MSTSIRLKQSSAWVALLALASAAASTNPHDTEDRHSTQVDYADLNVHTLAGAAILYHRIQRAAHEVCGADSDFGRHGQWESCCRMAIAGAVAKVNSPWLTAIHDTRTGAGPKLAALRAPAVRPG